MDGTSAKPENLHMTSSLHYSYQVACA